MEKDTPGMKFQSLQLLAFLALGAAFGGLYMGALAWNVRLYCAGSILPAMSLHLLRFLGAAAILVAFARTGAAPLLWSVVGFQLARVFVFSAKFFTLEAAL
jgi:F1F0 ATPase subunit 2